MSRKGLHSLLCLTLAWCALLACQRIDEPQPAAKDPRQMWNFFWQDLRMAYPFFAYDRVNWQEVDDTIRPQITSSTTERQLYTYITEALTPLLDGHASLTAPSLGLIWSHPDRQRRRSGFSIKLVAHNYLRADTVHYQVPLLQTGTPDPGILYIWIRNFELAGVAGQVAQAIAIANPSGLILDVRSNPGGLISESEAVAGLFWSASHTWGRQKIKNGPGPGDFTSLDDLVLAPGKSLFSGKVALLTNHYSASASERLRLMTRGAPNVVCIGDTTYGATSPIIERTLPNGWTYVSVGSVTLDLQGINYERRGVPPDVVIQNDTTDLRRGRDKALEAAIAAVR